MSSTAQRIRSVRGFQDDAFLWRIQPPVEGTAYLVTSRAANFAGKYETAAFPADQRGTVLSWTPYAIDEKDHPDEDNHATLLQGAGFTIRGTR